MGSSPVDTTKASMDAATTATLSTTHSKCGRASVSYSGLDDPVQMRAWDPNTLRLGYGLPANVSVFFVAYENDTILGVKHVTTNSSVAATGETFTLNTQLSGTHTVNVMLYEDTNENGDYDPNADSLCRRNGTAVQTGPRTFNFSEFDSE